MWNVLRSGLKRKNERIRNRMVGRKMMRGLVLLTHEHHSYETEGGGTVNSWEAVV